MTFCGIVLLNSVRGYIHKHNHVTEGPQTSLLHGCISGVAEQRVLPNIHRQQPSPHQLEEETRLQVSIQGHCGLVSCLLDHDHHCCSVPLKHPHYPKYDVQVWLQPERLPGGRLDEAGGDEGEAALLCQEV